MKVLDLIGKGFGYVLMSMGVSSPKSSSKKKAKPAVKPESKPSS
jgi:hypothetical protein